jgi:hypothetical protein
MLVLCYACNVNVQEDVIVIITSFNEYTCLPVPALYSASHSWVAPENVGLQKEQKCNTFALSCL